MKHFSFIRSKNLDFDEETEIFSFDKEIRKLLLPHCDKIILKKIKTSADDYFDSFLKNAEKIDDKFLFCLSYWVNLIVLLSIDGQELRKKFDAKISLHLKRIENHGLFDKSVDILQKFLNKLKKDQAEESSEYYFFMLKLGMIKQSQDKDGEALNLIETAYKKFLDLSGEKNSDTVNAMSNLIILLLKMRQDERIKDLEEKSLNICNEICNGRLFLSHRAIGNLAAALKFLNCLDEAQALQIRARDFCKNSFGEENLDTINAMNNLAVILRYKKDYKKALELQEKVVELYRKIGDAESLDSALAMSNLSSTLEKLNRYEESLEYRRQSFYLYKRILSADHKFTQTALRNFNNTLMKLNRIEEILEG